MDDFYEPESSADSSAFSNVLSAPLGLVVAGLLAPFVVVLATRLLSGRASERAHGKNGRTVWLLPYWIPVIGHAFSL